MDITPRRRRALSTLLAFVLAIESVSVVAAAAQVNVAQRGSPTTSAGPTAAPATSAGPAAATRTDIVAVGPWTRDGGLRAAGLPDGGRPDPEPAADASAPAVTAAAAPDRPRPSRPAVSNLAKLVAPAKAVESRSTSPADYRGRNHVWIPSLGINRAVAWFPCDRQRPPDNHVYRWGCAGTNNVYLLGHAYSVFDPLHDAYVSGRLHKGMKAYYADAKGKVHAYAVRWWRVTLPTPDASWAWASLAKPSMTLQTCVGKDSKYRLIVRLVEVGD